VLHGWTTQLLVAKCHELPQLAPQGVQALVQAITLLQMSVLRPKTVKWRGIDGSIGFAPIICAIA